MNRTNDTWYHYKRAALVLALIFLPTMVLAQSLTVIYPNGGESFHADSTITVRWASSGIDDELEIEYSTDGGDNWRRIGRTGGSATSISWTIPARISSSVRVRVITKDEDYSDESDGTFEILENPLDAAIVFSPNGGEIWTEGETQTIRWQLPLDAIDATVELSTNNGATWSTIATVPALPASLQWRVPHLSDNDITGAMVRVSVTEAADHFDISDAPFTIKPRPAAPVPSLRLLLPNGGERLKADSTLWIRWDAENVTGEVEVEYSINGGIDWSGIGNRDVAAGSIDWKIPDRPTGAALVRIAMRGDTLKDLSDAPFSIIRRDTIVPPDTSGGTGGEEIATRLLSPNGGESWTEGEEHAITWQLPATVTSALIEISLDNGVVWSPITLAPAASGSYMWRVPRFASTTITGALVRVSDPASSARIDRSDAAFTLLPRGSVSSVDDESSVRGELASQVFPSPASDRAEIRWQQSGSAEVFVRLFAADGTIARHLDVGLRAAGGNSLSVDLSGLPAGIYIYELRADRLLRGRVVVVR